MSQESVEIVRAVYERFSVEDDARREPGRHARHRDGRGWS